MTRRNRDETTASHARSNYGDREMTELIHDWLLVVALILIVGCGASTILYGQRTSAPHFGSITGRVLDESGKPVAGGKVSAQTTGPSAGGIYETFTDSSGRFRFAEIQADTYRLYATKDGNGFEDVSWIFFYLIAPWTAEVTVREHQMSKGITVRMFSKRGKLRGSLVDAETSQPIKDATLFLCRKDRNSCVGVNNDLGGRFHVLVPSIPSRARAYAPGYQDWYYGKDGSKENAEALQIAPNAIKELTIPLRRTR